MPTRQAPDVRRPQRWCGHSRSTARRRPAASATRSQAARSAHVRRVRSNIDVGCRFAGSCGDEGRSASANRRHPRHRDSLLVGLTAVCEHHERRAFTFDDAADVVGAERARIDHLLGEQPRQGPRRSRHRPACPGDGEIKQQWPAHVPSRRKCCWGSASRWLANRRPASLHLTCDVCCRNTRINEFRRNVALGDDYADGYVDGASAVARRLTRRAAAGTLPDARRRVPSRTRGDWLMSVSSGGCRRVCPSRRGSVPETRCSPGTRPVVDAAEVGARCRCFNCHVRVVRPACPRDDGLNGAAIVHEFLFQCCSAVDGSHVPGTKVSAGRTSRCVKRRKPFRGIAIRHRRERRDSKTPRWQTQCARAAGRRPGRRPYAARPKKNLHLGAAKREHASIAHGLQSEQRCARLHRARTPHPPAV